jgi:hypothetical protein
MMLELISIEAVAGFDIWLAIMRCCASVDTNARSIWLSCKYWDMVPFFSWRKAVSTMNVKVYISVSGGTPAYEAPVYLSILISFPGVNSR